MRLPLSAPPDLSDQARTRHPDMRKGIAGKLNAFATEREAGALMSMVSTTLKGFNVRVPDRE